MRDNEKERGGEKERERENERERGERGGEEIGVCVMRSGGRNQKKHRKKSKFFDIF